MQSSGFSAFGLGQIIENNVAALGIAEPTPVQQQAIPLLMQGNDLIASAPTGTGKTAAFLLPSLSRLAQPSTKRGVGPRILVLTPTRELAQQVANAAKDFSQRLSRVKTVCVTGGESYFAQNKALSTPHEILVATPGRLMDQMNSGRIDFSRLEVLVLDEADRMLDMGFADDVMAIAAALPTERQTVCFTATMSHTVLRLSSQLQRDAQRLEVKAEVARTDAIDQQVIYVDNVGHKRRLLSHWLSGEASGQAVVFTATKRDADELAEALDAEGHAAVALHGDLEQRQRTRMLNRLRRGEARVLVATDVAARGIDVAGITHVFNFDLPRFAEDYVHRIGRTGRAGATGVAVSFVNRDEIGLLRRIERFIGNRVRVATVAGMEAKFDPRERSPRPGPRSFDGRRPQGRPGERREGGFGERREGGGFGERREGGGFGERRSYGDRGGFRNHEGQGDSRPARRDGERPQGQGFGERRSFDDRGDRKPYGERSVGERSFGERKFGERREAGASTGNRDGERRGFSGGFGDRRPAGGDRGGRPGGFDRPRRKFD